jgi:predicted MPP superfamily phosphohydrolase
MMTPGLRFALFLAVVLAVWVAEHLYVGWRALSLAPFADGTPRRVVIAALAVLFLAYPAGRIVYQGGLHAAGRALECAGAVWMGTLMLLVCTLLIVDVLTLGGRLFAQAVPAARATAIGVALIAALAALWGGSRGPEVVRHTVALAGLDEATREVRLVQLSDVHLGTLLGPGRLAPILEQVAALEADVVVITGDLIDGDVGVVEEFLPLLRTLRAPRGVFAILGNHEYYAGRERSRRLLADAGYRVLDNEAAEVAPGLWVAGVPDARGGAQTGGAEDDLGAAIAAVPPGDAVVLLQHAPEREWEAAAAGVDLLLNGHTHGGQIWPFHWAVRTAYERIAGRFTHAGMTQIVSRGTGFWGPPMRLFAPAEIIVVELVADPPP